MSSFFEPPPLPPEPPERPARPPRRPWHGGPNRVVGRTVALNLVLGQSDKGVIWIPSVTAYPDVFEFQVEIRYQGDADGFPDVRGAALAPTHRSADAELDPEVLRLGIQLSDGGKATTRYPGFPFPGPSGRDIPPAGPILGGGGGDAGWNYRYWVWPLPPEGPLAFVCEWPIADIPETRSEIDSTLLRDAAADAIIVWPENESEASHDGGSTMDNVWRVVLEPEPSKPPGPAESDETS